MFRCSSTAWGVMPKVFGSTSTKTGVNPVKTIALMVAIYVKGVVIIFEFSLREKPQMMEYNIVVRRGSFAEKELKKLFKGVK